MLRVKSVVILKATRHFELWWWNKDLDVAVCRKGQLFRIWKQSRNEEVRKTYCVAKKIPRE